jgi:hypothetical protein
MVPISSRRQKKLKRISPRLNSRSTNPLLEVLNRTKKLKVNQKLPAMEKTRRRLNKKPSESLLISR